MILTCPLCGMEMESEVEIASGQHVICPFCEKKFSYGENSTAIAESVDAPGPETAEEKEPVAKFCWKCGTAAIPGTVFCMKCGTDLRAGAKDAKPEVVSASAGASLCSPYCTTRDVMHPTRNVACPNCGKIICVPDTDDNGLVACPWCDHEFFPFGYSKMAVVAFYLGLFSCLIIPAPFALAAGLFALKDIKENRGKHGKARAWFGVVLGGVFCPPAGIAALVFCKVKKARSEK